MSTAICDGPAPRLDGCGTRCSRTSLMRQYALLALITVRGHKTHRRAGSCGHNATRYLSGRDARFAADRSPGRYRPEPRIHARSAILTPWCPLPDKRDQAKPRRYRHRALAGIRVRNASHGWTHSRRRFRERGSAHKTFLPPFGIHADRPNRCHRTVLWRKRFRERRLRGIQRPLLDIQHHNPIRRQNCASGHSRAVVRCHLAQERGAQGPSAVRPEACVAVQVTDITFGQRS